MEPKNSEPIDLPGQSQSSLANPIATIKPQKSESVDSPAIVPKPLYLGASMEPVTVQRAPGRKSNRTFTRFRDLAKEIRLKIWQYCFPRNRNVVICNMEDYDWVGGGYGDEKLPNDSLYVACEPRRDLITPSYHEQWNDMIDKNTGRNHWKRKERTAEPPITLQINRESREETLNFYVVLYPGLTKKPIYFNPTLDITFFRNFFSTDISEWNRYAAIAQFALQIQTNVHTVGTLHMRTVNTLHTTGVTEEDNTEGDGEDSKEDIEETNKENEAEEDKEDDGEDEKDDDDYDHDVKYDRESFKEIICHYLSQGDDEYPLQIANRNTHHITWDFEEGSVDATAFTGLAVILLSTSTYDYFGKFIHNNCELRHFIEEEFWNDKEKHPDLEIPIVLYDSEWVYDECISFKKEPRGT